jgi:hypothetical protein
MQIFVRTLDDRTLTLNVQPEDTINEIKEIVEQREGNSLNKIYFYNIKFFFFI